MQPFDTLTLMQFIWAFLAIGFHSFQLKRIRIIFTALSGELLGFLFSNFVLASQCFFLYL